MRLPFDNAEDIFDTPDGKEYVTGSLRFLRATARAAPATLRIDQMKGRVPPHIYEDILSQSYELAEFVGRCEMIFTFFRISRKKGFDYNLLKQIFITVFEDTCRRKDSLEKLCELTISTYGPKGVYIDRSAKQNP